MRNQPTKPTMAARPSSATNPIRRSSAANPNDFAHPYLASSTQRMKTKKRELGLCNLFLFKVCGCFSGDELPPPNFDAPIYQAAKSTSSNLTFNTNTTTTPTTSRTQSPSKQATLSTTTTTTTTTTATSRASTARHGIIGSTGVEDIPYRRPPPEQTPQQPVSNTPNHTSQAGRPASFSRNVPHSERVTTIQTMPRNRTSDGVAWKSRAPVELAENDELETRKIVGNVSRLSAMFDEGE